MHYEEGRSGSYAIGYLDKRRVPARNKDAIEPEKYGQIWQSVVPGPGTYSVLNESMDWRLVF
jgi:hypothetical protein